MNYFDSDDIICAVATPPGVGGISVIRLCGVESEKVIRKVCSFLPRDIESHKVYYGFIKNKDNVDIDEVLVTYFQEGKSFTGNNVFEVSCHGGKFITKKILELLIDSGARLAQKGEFTYRAFSSGRIDLIQAESVLSMIQSQSDKLSNISLDQLKGHLSTDIGLISDRLTLILANLEANIDFSAEDIELVSAKEFIDEVKLLMDEVDVFIQSYSTGKKLKDGIQISLVGLPNAGKSSFLNSLIGEEKAIVTNIPGTTRDIVESSFILDGVEFNISDTAGIHITDDPIEKIGINKTIDSIKGSDFVLFLYDGSVGAFNQQSFHEIFKVIKNEECIFVNTKSDLINDLSSLVLSDESFVSKFSYNLNFRSYLSVSSTSSDGLNDVRSWLKEQSKINFNESSSVLTQARHYELLRDCYNKLQKSRELMENNESPEFIAFEMQAALKFIYEVLGRTYDDQVMDKVFNEFCIGK